jgi:quinoprotein glucose dehydrogenase
VDRELNGQSIVATTPGAIFQDLLILSTRTEAGPRRRRPATSAPTTRARGNAAGSFIRFRIPANSDTIRGPPEAWKTRGRRQLLGRHERRREAGHGFSFLRIAHFDFYGGDRAGMNLFGNSILP